MTDEPDVYSPRLDAAVGPFATHGRFGREYDTLIRKHSAFLRRLYDAHASNVGALGNLTKEFSFAEVCRRNWNARCFIAIEIENSVSRKHLMGGAINAAALGRIGVAVGWDDGKVNALIRLRSYLLYLARVGKNTFLPTNLLVLSASQLDSLLPGRRTFGSRPTAR